MDGLRQDDVHEGRQPGKTQGDAGFGLPLVDALDAGTENLGAVGRKIQAEGDDGDQHRVDVHRSEDDVEDQHQQHQHRGTAQDGDVEAGRQVEQASRRHAHETDRATKQRTQEGREYGNNDRGLQAVPDQQVTILNEDVAMKTGCNTPQPACNRITLDCCGRLRRQHQGTDIVAKIRP